MLAIASVAALAGANDAFIPVRTGTTGNITLAPTGPNGAWQTIATTATNGVLQTTGSGLAVNASPIVAGTGAIATPVAGQLGWSGTSLMVYTGSVWKNAP